MILALAVSAALPAAHAQTAPGLATGDVTLTVVAGYNAAAGDEIRTLLHVTAAPYAVPSLSLVESDRLQLVLTYADYTSTIVALPYRYPIWRAGDEVRVRAIWDLSSPSPFVALIVNGELAGLAEARRVRDFASTDQQLFVGHQWSDGTHAFDGDLTVLRSEPRPQVTASEIAALPVWRPASAVAGEPEPADLPARQSLQTRRTQPATGEASLANRYPFPGGVASREPTARAALERPAVGEWVAAPGYGTAVTRLTEDSDRGGFATQVYSQLQAFSPDGSYLLVTSDRGYRVIRFPGGDEVELDTWWWNAPRWNPASDHEILAYDANDDTSLALLGVDVTSGRERVAYAFPQRFERIRGNRSFDELSRDGRWVAGMATMTGGRRAIFAVDLVRGTLEAEVYLDELYGAGGRCAPDRQYGILEPDWIGVSPLGSVLVVQWVRDWGPGVGGCSGLEAWELQTGDYVGRIMNGHPHGDLGLTTDGREVFYTVALASPEDPNRPAVVMHDVPTGTRRPSASGPGGQGSGRGSDADGVGEVVDPAGPASAPTFLLTIPWGAAEHLSAQGPPGVVLIGSGAYDPGAGGLVSQPAEAFLQEVALIFEDGSFRRVGRTRTSACGYWAQARATVSPDGRYVAFASDWWAATGDSGCEASELGAADLYVIDLAGNSGRPER